MFDYLSIAVSAFPMLMMTSIFVGMILLEWFKISETCLYEDGTILFKTHKFFFMISHRH